MSFHKSIGAKVKFIDPKSQANNPFQKGLVESIWSWTTDLIFKKPQKPQNVNKKPKIKQVDPGIIRYYKFYDGETDPEEMYEYFRNLFKSIISSHKDGKYRECLKFIKEYQIECTSDMFHKLLNLITQQQRDKILYQDIIVIKLSVRYTRNREKSHFDLDGL